MYIVLHEHDHFLPKSDTACRLEHFWPPDSDCLYKNIFFTRLIRVETKVWESFQWFCLEIRNLKSVVFHFGTDMNLFTIGHSRSNTVKLTVYSAVSVKSAINAQYRKITLFLSAFTDRKQQFMTACQIKLMKKSVSSDDLLTFQWSWEKTNCQQTTKIILMILEQWVIF